jgi:hypothetical protein
MAAAAIVVVVVVVPVRLHKTQSKIPARIIKIVLTEKPNFFTKLFGKLLYAKKKHIILKQGSRPICMQEFF